MKTKNKAMKHAIINNWVQHYITENVCNVDEINYTYYTLVPYSTHRVICYELPLNIRF